MTNATGAIQPGPEDDVLREACSERCHIFAMALSARTGLPILAVGKALPGNVSVGHYCVEVDAGTVADIDGIWPKPALLAEWGADTLTPTTYAAIEDALVEGAEDDHAARTAVCAEVHQVVRRILTEPSRFHERVRRANFESPSATFG